MKKPTKMPPKKEMPKGMSEKMKGKGGKKMPMKPGKPY